MAGWQKHNIDHAAFSKLTLQCSHHLLPGICEKHATLVLSLTGPYPLWDRFESGIDSCQLRAWKATLNKNLYNHDDTMKQSIAEQWKVEWCFETRAWAFTTVQLWSTTASYKYVFIFNNHFLNAAPASKCQWFQASVNIICPCVRKATLYLFI